MGTISEKLVYLNGTKQAIKQAINEDFEVIDNNTTFREYADEISSNNAKYKDLIPKETTNATNTLNISNSAGLDNALVTQYGNTKQSILPSQYTQVDYIESSGTQFINTNYYAKSTTKYAIDFQATSNLSTGIYLFGSRISSTSENISVSLGSNYFVGRGNNFISGKKPDYSRHLIEVNPDSVFLDGTNISSVQTVLSGTATYPLYLMCMNQGGDLSRTFYGKVFNCKIYDNNILVRNFIPCYRKSDNEIGFYDIVNDEFYTNDGTGTFTYGSEMPTPDTPQEIVNISGSTTINITDNNNHSKNYNISLPSGIELCKIDTYKDRIYPLNGKWYLEKKIGKVVLDGTETWSNFYGTNLFNINGYFNDKPFIIGYGLSNYYKYNSIQSGVNNGTINGEFVLQKSSSSYNIFIKNTDYSVPANFKTWLGAHNTSIYYPLETPITTEITESNYPTLYEQLNNIKLYEGVNHLTLTNESGLDVEFDIEYYKNWKLD